MEIVHETEQTDPQQSSAEYTSTLTTARASLIASPAVTPDEDCFKIENMKQMNADNKNENPERMIAMAVSNLKKGSARRAKYDAELQTQRRLNDDSKAVNAKKVSDLSSANENKANAQRTANDTEIDEMRRQNEQGQTEHNAWVHRLRSKNKAQMAQMAKDGDEKLKAMKQRGRAAEVRHEKEIAANQATHDAEMFAIEQKHEVDLTAARQSREENLARHKSKMAAMEFQHQHETDEMELRQQNEVEALSRANEAKAAKEAKKMKALKGKNQSRMDDMCRLMTKIEALEAQIEVKTEHFFALADNVKDERAAMRSYEELARMTEKSLTVQMTHIRAVREEITESQRKAAKVTTTGSIKELYKTFKTLMAEQDRTRRRISRRIDAFEKINNKLLEEYKRILN